MLTLLAGSKSRKIVTVIVALLLVVGLGWWAVWHTLFRVAPDPYSAPGVSPEARFKYGSIGAEPTVGIPYWVWVVLPSAFPEHLPGPNGYASLGTVWEAGQETPIGLPKVDIGVVPRVGINCALCHTATYRKSPAEVAPTVVTAGPAHQFNLLAYQQFLFASAGDPRFTADTILGEINKVRQLSWAESLLYRYLIIPRTKSDLLENKAAWEWTYRNPAWGPGRIDPFNPVKFGLLEQPVDNTVGNADMVPLWNLGTREGMVLHWDGLNRSMREVFLSSAIGDGATPGTLDLDYMTQLEGYLKALPPPRFPFPVNAGLAAQGKAVFDGQCAACHTAGRGRIGQVIPIAEIGTDPHRMAMWAQKDADAYMRKYQDYPWGFKAFQDLEGYVAVPLDGLWLRAPYLHNGSVPTLRDLLEPPERRPKQFFRGYDVYDPERVGFVSDVAKDDASGRAFFRFDTAAPGNSNQGHLYGTGLADAEKAALVEYLKSQ